MGKYERLLLDYVLELNRSVSLSNKEERTLKGLIDDALFEAYSRGSDDERFDQLERGY